MRAIAIAALCASLAGGCACGPETHVVPDGGVEGDAAPLGDAAYPDAAILDAGPTATCDDGPIPVVWSDRPIEALSLAVARDGRIAVTYTLESGDRPSPGTWLAIFEADGVRAVAPRPVSDHARAVALGEGFLLASPSLDPARFEAIGADGATLATLDTLPEALRMRAAIVRMEPLETGDRVRLAARGERGWHVLTVSLSRTLTIEHDLELVASADGTVPALDPSGAAAGEVAIGLADDRVLFVQNTSGLGFDGLATAIELRRGDDGAWSEARRLVDWAGGPGSPQDARWIGSRGEWWVFGSTRDPDSRWFRALVGRLGEGGAELAPIVLEPGGEAGGRGGDWYGVHGAFAATDDGRAGIVYQQYDGSGEPGYHVFSVLDAAGATLANGDLPPAQQLAWSAAADRFVTVGDVSRGLVMRCDLGSDGSFSTIPSDLDPAWPEAAMPAPPGSTSCADGTFVLDGDDPMALLDLVALEGGDRLAVRYSTEHAREIALVDRHGGLAGTIAQPPTAGDAAITSFRDGLVVAGEDAIHVFDRDGVEVTSRTGVHLVPGALYGSVPAAWRHGDGARLLVSTDTGHSIVTVTLDDAGAIATSASPIEGLAAITAIGAEGDRLLVAGYDAVVRELGLDADGTWRERERWDLSGEVDVVSAIAWHGDEWWITAARGVPGAPLSRPAIVRVGAAGASTTLLDAPAVGDEGGYHHASLAIALDHAPGRREMVAFSQLGIGVAIAGTDPLASPVRATFGAMWGSPPRIAIDGDGFALAVVGGAVEVRGRRLETAGRWIELRCGL